MWIWIRLSVQSDESGKVQFKYYQWNILQSLLECSYVPEMKLNILDVFFKISESVWLSYVV